MPVTKVCVLLAWHATCGRSEVAIELGGIGIDIGWLSPCANYGPRTRRFKQQGRAEGEGGSPEGDIVQVKMESGTTRPCGRPDPQATPLRLRGSHKRHNGYIACLT